MYILQVRPRVTEKEKGKEGEESQEEARTSRTWRKSQREAGA